MRCEKQNNLSCQDIKYIKFYAERFELMQIWRSIFFIVFYSEIQSVTNFPNIVQVQWNKA
jgi:hypothetical protein